MKSSGISRSRRQPQETGNWHSLWQGFQSQMVPLRQQPSTLPCSVIKQWEVSWHTMTRQPHVHHSAAPARIQNGRWAPQRHNPYTFLHHFPGQTWVSRFPRFSSSTGREPHGSWVYRQRMRLGVEDVSVERNKWFWVVGEQQVEIFERFSEPEALHFVPVLRTCRRLDISYRRVTNWQFRIPVKMTSLAS